MHGCRRGADLAWWCAGCRPRSSRSPPSPTPTRDVRAVADGLGLSEPVAVTLVRRGYRTPELARRFLAADESHPPDGLRLDGSAVDLVLEAVEAEAADHRPRRLRRRRRLRHRAPGRLPARARRRRRLADPRPDRRRLRAQRRRTSSASPQRGTNLLITVDCGITSVDRGGAGPRAGDGGDRHRPPPGRRRAARPARSSTRQSTAIRSSLSAGPPSPGSWRRLCALRRDGPTTLAPSASTADLDLVALATVADMVPLVGENRSLVKRGLAALRLAARPGLRALIAVSGMRADRARRVRRRLPAGAADQRRRPPLPGRRRGRADADRRPRARAQQIAEELGRANSERRATEREVDAAAEAPAASCPRSCGRLPAWSWRGRGGIPAWSGSSPRGWSSATTARSSSSRSTGRGRAAARAASIPGFDLLAALRACAGHLESFGGHRAAAGLSLRAENLEAFRAAVRRARHRGPRPRGSPRGPSASTRWPAASASASSWPKSCASWPRSGSATRACGCSSPRPGSRTCGRWAPRASTPASASTAARTAPSASPSAAPSLGVEGDEAVDAAVRLEVNHWNGSVEPRVVLRELHPLDGGPDAEAAPATARLRVRGRRVVAALRGRAGGRSGCDRAGRGAFQSRGATQTRHGRIAVRGSSSAGGRDRRAGLERSRGARGQRRRLAPRRPRRRSRRARPLQRRQRPGRLRALRLGGAGALLVKAEGGLALTDYATLAAAGPSAPRGRRQLRARRPRRSADSAAALAARLGRRDGLPARAPQRGRARVRARRARRVARLEDGRRRRLPRPARPAPAALTGPALREALFGAGGRPLAPEAAARAFRVLVELELAQGAPNAGSGLVERRILRGNGSGAIGRVPRLSRPASGGQQFLARPKQQ